MAGIIQPIPDNGAGAPETLPWATSGTVLEPIPAQEATGWQPYGIGPAPDYRIENYFRNMLRRWLERLQQSALLVEYCSATATVAGFVDPPLAGWTYNVTIDGNLVVTTVTTELTKPEVCRAERRHCRQRTDLRRTSDELRRDSRASRRCSRRVHLRSWRHTRRHVHLDRPDRADPAH